MASLPQLLALLGSQGAGNVPIPGTIGGYAGGTYNPNGRGGLDEVTPVSSLPPEEQGPDIEVTPSVQVENPLYKLLPRKDTPAEIQQAAPDLQSMPRTSASPQEKAASKPYDNLEPHKGMFGIKGTLRDVLGILGDAMLAAGGRQAIYRPQRQQENLSDAMTGFGTADPQTQQAILQRVAQVDPEAARQLAQQMQTQQGQVRQQANLERQIASDQQRNLLSKMKLAQGMMLQAKTPEAKTIIREWLQDPSSSIQDIPDDLITASGINPYQRESLDQRKEVIEQRDRLFDKAEAGRMARDNPPPAPRPNRKSASNVDAEILEAVRNGTATPAEQRIYNERLRRGGKKPTTLESMRQNAGSAPTASKFKPGQIIYKGPNKYKVNADGKTATPIK